MEKKYIVGILKGSGLNRVGCQESCVGFVTGWKLNRKWRQENAVELADLSLLVVENGRKLANNEESGDDISYGNGPYWLVEN